MKKNAVLILVLSLFTNILHAQKEDFNWLSGYSAIPLPANDSSDFGLISINFTNNLPIQKRVSFAPTILDNNNTCISDKNGNLLFHYNGNDIFNSEYKIMKNSDSLNYTKPINFLQAYQHYVPQGGLILPYPDHENQYMLIHQQVEYLVIKDSLADIRGERLYYSIIDMNKENGLGEVIERKKLILADSMEYGKLSACRHANGRDWWIIVQVNSTPTYYKILLNEEGIKIYDKQTIGNDNYSSLGYAIFSPDGKSYVNFDPVGYNLDCAIFNFDRCTGKLSNFKGLKSGIPIDSIFAGGAAISPNSRFLYFILNNYVFQYDLWATDIAKSKVLIAKYDNFLDDNNLPTRFFMGQLAPNGKIYISSTSATRYLHVINKPDLKGDSCELVQHGYKLLTINGFGLPNLPNFRLGKADVVCNMVGMEEVEKAKDDIKIYPNPNTGDFFLDKGENLATKVVVYDIAGKIVFTQNISEKVSPIRLENLQNGVYYCRLLGNEAEIVPIKFTIIH